ncbi:MAG TPA: carboxylesterase family protein [Bryobacteraceae bacterium]|jgi:para-nitrobenzyl esterase
MNELSRRQVMQSAAGIAAAGAVQARGAQTTAAPGVAASSKTVVDTESGKVRGFVNRGVWVFRGIPYAEPSGGANRFLPPVKPKPWPGVRSCLTYGPSCPSGIGISEGGDNSPRADEDNFLLYRTGGWQRGENCLRLNVWSPGPNSRRKRAVMVFMHGGGYTGGSGNDLLSYDGENLARHHDVVVVTHNHRLNVFGFLNLAEIGGERYASSGNVGMLDNVAVLEWVRDNIANFGGDPGNVMIYGQSGGGGKVSHLMVMPAAKGLFHRAVVESGATLRTGSAEAAAKVADALLQELNIPRSQFEKIQTVSTANLVTAQGATLRRLAGSGGRPAGGGWGPILDGKVIPAHPFDPSAPEVSRNVPMMIGTCLNEFVNGVDNPEVDSLTNEELQRRVSQRYGEHANDIIAAYRRDYPKERAFGIWAAISAATVRQNTATQAERKAAQGGAPAYQYIYAWRTPMLDNRPGTFHSSEIAFVFDNGDLCTRYSGGGPEALKLSYAVGEAWASFARTGKPGHRGLPEWPGYTATQRATMVFNSTCAVRNDPEGEGLKLVRQADASKKA